MENGLDGAEGYGPALQTGDGDATQVGPYTTPTPRTIPHPLPGFGAVASGSCGLATLPIGEPAAIPTDVLLGQIQSLQTMLQQPQDLVQRLLEERQGIAAASQRAAVPRQDAAAPQPQPAATLPIKDEFKIPSAVQNNIRKLGKELGRNLVKFMSAEDKTGKVEKELAAFGTAGSESYPANFKPWTHNPVHSEYNSVLKAAVDNDTEFFLKIEKGTPRAETARMINHASHRLLKSIELECLQDHSASLQTMVAFQRFSNTAAEVPTDAPEVLDTLGAPRSEFDSSSEKFKKHISNLYRSIVLKLHGKYAKKTEAANDERDKEDEVKREADNAKPETLIEELICRIVDDKLKAHEDDSDAMSEDRDVPVQDLAARVVSSLKPEDSATASAETKTGQVKQKRRRYTKAQLSAWKAAKNGQSPGATQGQNGKGNGSGFLPQNGKTSGKGKGKNRKGKGKGSGKGKASGTQGSGKGGGGKSSGGKHGKNQRQ
eukprot:TRINITY_DN101682_c0_g1_i1.p2 TRINITY_DN101682_c0_g1~~TRINITY_DN101682_c0_g1_i1.p2  ORF type:complete len:488 (-),score=83.54 TRINITY_DN101682_c0_g1_i1:1870-3333(-)